MTTIIRHNGDKRNTEKESRLSKGRRGNLLWKKKEISSLQENATLLSNSLALNEHKTTWPGFFKGSRSISLTELVASVSICLTFMAKCTLGCFKRRHQNTPG